MKPGFEPFRTPDTPDAADQAKAFCVSRGLTPDMVKIVRSGGYVRVIVKKECKIKV